MEARTFEQLLEEAFSFLETEYGFTRVKENDWQYAYETQDCSFLVFMEYGRLVIGLEPQGNGAKQLTTQNILPRRIDIIVVSECLDPKLKYEMVTLEDGRSTNIPVEIHKRAELIRKYFGNFLKGDFSEWFQVEECLAERRKNFYNR